MFKNDDFYTPAQIDQQVDALLHGQDMPTRDQRLAHDLHDMLENAEEDHRSLQRVLAKLSAADSGPQQQSKIIPLSSFNHSSQERSGMMRYSEEHDPKVSQEKPMVRLFSTLAAVLVVAVLVGSMLFIVNTARRNGPATASKGPKTPVTTTHTPSLKEGQIVYQSKQYGLAMPVVWSPDGRRVATALDHTTVESWDALTGKNVLSYPVAGNSDAPGALTVNYVTNVAWSPDGSVLAVAESHTIYLFNAQTARLIRSFIPPTTAFSDVPVSPLVATGGAGQPAPLSSALPLSGGDIFGNVSWSPNGQHIAVVYNGPWHGTFNAIFIWNASSGALVKTISGFALNIESVSWSPKENLLAALGYDTPDSPSAAKVWDTTSWRIVKQYPDTLSFDWSPDGTRLALAATDSTGAPGSSVRLVDALSGQTTTRFTTPAGPVHWSPDGTRLAIEGPGNATARGGITIWSIAGGKQLSSFSQRGAYPYNAVWSPDSRFISCVQSFTTKHSDGKFYYVVQILIWVA